MIVEPTPAAGRWLDPVYAPWDGNGYAMSRDIGEKPVTVNQWRFRGSIPDQYRPRIIAEAARRGFALTLEDFIHPDHRVAAASVA